MNLKTIHTKDGRTLYKDLDTGHWVNKNNAEKILSDVREPQKEEQIAKAAKVAEKLNNPEPEYERTPKMDFIQKRIDSKKAEIERLNKKWERIEAARATNWEKNPYSYGDYDVRVTTKDLERAKKALEDYEAEMQTEIEKSKSRNVPAITEFLDNWEQRMIEYYKDQYKEYGIAYEKRRRDIKAYQDWRYSDAGYNATKEERDKRSDQENKARKKFRDDWMHVTQFNHGSKSWEETMIDDLRAEKIRKYDDIIRRTNEAIGQITDAGGLKVGKAGDLNGYLKGIRGRVSVETIGAGGYNIQCYHFRTLIHKLKEK